MELGEFISYALIFMIGFIIGVVACIPTKKEDW